MSVFSRRRLRSQVVLEVGRIAVELALVADRQAALGGEGELVAVGTKHLAHQGLVVADAVDGRGVEEGVARLKRAQQHLLSLPRGGGAP